MPLLPAALPCGPGRPPEPGDGAQPPQPRLPWQLLSALALSHAALSPGSAAAAAKPAALLSWLPPLLLGLALIALLLRWRWAWLTDCYDWFVVNIGGLLEPLRGRRHVIHDPKYLRRILEAEFGSIDPARSARPGQPRRPPRPGWRWGHRRSRRWRRSRR